MIGVINFLEGLTWTSNIGRVEAQSYDSSYNRLYAHVIIIPFSLDASLVECVIIRLLVDV